MTYWRYDHARRQTELPQPGALIVEHHRVWRVVEVNPVAELDWTDEERKKVGLYKAEYRERYFPSHIVLRPAEVTSTDVRARDRDKHYRVQADASGQWNVYRDEHYPVCNVCGEPTPCRDRIAMREAQDAVARMSRYEDPGRCPSCEEGFTPRQKTYTFDVNIKIPAGPRVTFHRRGECGWAATQYEKELVKAYPELVSSLFCSGTITNHNDNTYECSTGASCPGLTTHHETYQACVCAPCNAHGPFHCMPSPTATRRTA